MPIIQRLPFDFGKSKHGCFIFARSNGQPVGILRLSFSKEPTAYLEDLFVAHPVRRQGVATALVNEAIVLARLHDCESITLNVSKNNKRALLFYRRMKFILSFEEDDGELYMTRAL